MIKKWRRFIDLHDQELTSNHSFPAGEKEAAAEKVAALWRSRIAAQRQLVLVRDIPEAMELPKSTNPVQKVVRNVHFSRSRSRSGSRWRPQADHGNSGIPKRGRSRRSRSASSSENSTPPKTHSGQQGSHNLSTEPTIRGVLPTAPGQGQKQEIGGFELNSATAMPNHGSKIEDPEDSKVVGLGELQGPDPENLSAQLLLTLFLKFFLKPSSPRRSHSSRQDLISQALQHPKEAGR